MAFYMDEEEVWKCPKHPSKRRRTGICHVCLRERLSSLCPECANVRPCACSFAATTTTTSSSNSSYSSSVIGGAVGRVSNLIDRGPPALRRSRSLAVPFLRSKHPPAPPVDHQYSPSLQPKTVSFWSRLSRSKRYNTDQSSVTLMGEQEEVNNNKNNHNNNDDHDDEDEEQRRRRRRMMMRKSRSVAVTASDSDSVNVSVKSSKGRSWYFPTPIKAFRQSISRALMVQERSPLYRG